MLLKQEVVAIVARAAVGGRCLNAKLPSGERRIGFLPKLPEIEDNANTNKMKLRDFRLVSNP